MNGKARAYALEVGRVAGLITNEYFQRTLDHCHRRGEGSAAAFYLIGAWAILFMDAHQRTNWAQSALTWDEAIIADTEKHLRIVESNY